MGAWLGTTGIIFHHNQKIVAAVVVEWGVKLDNGPVESSEGHIAAEHTVGGGHSCPIHIAAESIFVSVCQIKVDVASHRTIGVEEPNAADCARPPDFGGRIDLL